MPTDSRTQALLAAIRRWNTSHGPGQQVDPRAELRVAGQEGLSGGIGDGGHAFGPNQLNDAGGVLTGKLGGLNPAQKNAWAWSPKGLEYALAGVAGAAGGEHGAGAVEDIVRKFERPADPNGEVSRALGGAPPQFGGGAAAGAPLSAGPAGPAAAPDPTARRQAILALMSSFAQPGGQGLAPFLTALQASRATPAPAGLAAAAAPRPRTPGPPPLAPRTGGIAELLQEGTGGPTHSTGPHVHAAFTNPQLELAAIARARSLGLAVLANPYVGSPPTPGVHAPDSYHYRDFPGSYNGRKLGEAIDVSGPRSDAFYQWLAARRGGK